MGYIRKALEKGYLEQPVSAYCTDDMFEIFVRFGWCLCCLLRLFVNRQVPCLHTNSRQRAVASPDAPQKPLVRKRARSGGVKWVQVSQDHQEKPILIRDDKMKWLDFGKTPDPENLDTHPGFAWMKSGYSEAIAWRKVRLTKQRNVDLTSLCKTVTTYPPPPPPNPYISETAFSHRFQKAYTYPPLRNEILVHWTKT